MKLKSFGCSFIFGSELSDDGSHLNYNQYSHMSWPALLAKNIGYEYECYARPGTGNLCILESILSQVEADKNDLYVIGWTWIDRFDYTTTDTPFQWRTVMPVDTNTVAETYYKNIHSEYRDKLTTLIYVRTAIDALRASGNRFIMTYMDDLMFDQRWNTGPSVSALQGYCEPYMTRFENKSFLEYSKEKGFEISQTLHPLEAAHEAAADLIASYNLV